MTSPRARSAAQIIKKIGCDKLTLNNGNGYWYFAYDDVEANIWETHSEYVMYLNSLTVDKWVEIGTEFVKRVKEEKYDRI